ncbi:hypothetical protein ACWDX6_28865 [Streptomyces sp. NPDC003027]
MAEHAPPLGARAQRLRSAVLAGTALTLLLTACGGAAEGGDGAVAAGAAPSPATTPAAAETLGTKEHFAALLTREDLPDHRVRGDVDVQMFPASAARTDAPACKPIADAMSRVPDGATGALIRPIGPVAKTLTTDVTIGTYTGTRAQEWFASLRAAVGPCAGGFTATDSTGTTTIRKAEPQPVSAGDEALAWGLTVERDGAPVVVRLAAVRKKNNVALFFTYDPAGGVDRQPMAVIDAQMAKLP